MGTIRRLMQPVVCSVGFHNIPPQRMPPGPLVATCPCCGKAIYCYGFSVHQCPAYPNLLLANFPRVLNAMPMNAIAAS